MSVYSEIGVKRVLNAAFALTRLGGRTVPKEVQEAMEKANEGYCNMWDLMEKGGQIISKGTGAEAALITSGGFAALTLAAAACIAGKDPEKMRRLPHSEGMKNEIIIQRCNRLYVSDRAMESKTQLTGVTGAVAIALLLVFAPSLLENLPNTALAAVVIASAISLFEIRDLRRLYRIQRWEFWLSMACFLGVAIFGPIPGILFAIIVALLEFVWDGWRPHYAVLARADGVKGYHDITRYPDARRIPGLVLFRWDAPLFFANAEQFHEHVLIEINNSPTPVRWFVVAAEPVTSVDVTAADMLAEWNDELHHAGIQSRTTRCPR